MLNWDKGRSLPRGIQDCAVTLINNKLIVIGGYCSGPMCSAIALALKHKIDYNNKRDKYVRGFADDVWMLDLKHEDRGWRSLPRFPGNARASMGITTIKNNIYCWGGYSFRPQKDAVTRHKGPKDKCIAYSDGYVFDIGESRWKELPELPMKLTNFNIVNDGQYIYILGGADIHASSKSHDTTVIGNKFYRIDSTNLQAGWFELSVCPGTYRMDASVTLVDNNIYVIGGVYPNPKWIGAHRGSERFYNILDNWKYDIKKSKWTSLCQSSHYISNWANNSHILSDNRYIYLLGGAYYYRNMFNNNLIEEKNEIVLKNSGCKPGEYEFIISDDVYRYDIIANEFELLEDKKLPFPINKPKWINNGIKIHIVGGESTPAGGKYRPYYTKNNIEGYVFKGEFFGFHSDLYAFADV